MIVTVFRSRLRPDIGDDYLALSNRMFELAQTMPGFVAIKDFVAEDGERVAIVEFAHADGQHAWRSHPAHIEAQKLGREKYYSEYHIQTCTLDRESKFNAAENASKART
jgi:heme-degrading monooxygenase HmoA